MCLILELLRLFLIFFSLRVTFFFQFFDFNFLAIFFFTFLFEFALFFPFFPKKIAKLKKFKTEKLCRLWAKRVEVSNYLNQKFQ